MSATTLSKKERVAGEKSIKRHRVNKTFIQKIAEEKGFLTPNEKVSLKGLSIKNALQRVNNRTLSINNQLTNKQCTALNKLYTAFIKDIDAIILVEVK